jgi:hypothetical protein
MDMPHIQLRIWKKLRINTINTPMLIRKAILILLTILSFLLISFLKMCKIKNIKRFSKEKRERKLTSINMKIFIQLYSPIWVMGRKLGLLSK